MAKKKAKTSKPVKKVKAAKKLSAHAKAFLALSDAVPPDQDKRQQALDCIARAFDSIGNPNVDDPSDQIDWGTFTESDCDDLAERIEDCLEGKGWDVPSLAAPFRVLHDANRVMKVSDLIDALIQISG